MYPPSHATSPGLDGRENATSKELESLRELIRKHEEQRIVLEKDMLARAEADAAKKMKEAEDAKKKEEIAAASAKAKKDAEDAAADVAKKAKEDSDKKLAEATKAKEEVETKRKELEEEIKKSKPSPDASKLPIKFKDAVHRKFSFPWGIAKTWKGTEGLIKQAFAHVDVLGQHVHEGHYDLLGPDGEIILPQVWETTVQPGWEVEMHMWPIAELERPERHHGHAGNDPFASMNMGELLSGLEGGAMKGGKKGKAGKKDKRKSQIVEVPMVNPNDPLAALFAPGGVMPGGIVSVPDKKSKGKSGSSSKKKKDDIPLFAQWMGVRPAKKDDEKLGTGIMVRRRSTSSADHKLQAQQQNGCLLM